MDEPVHLQHAGAHLLVADHLGADFDVDLQFALRLVEAVSICERAQRRHEVLRTAHQLQVLGELKRFPFAYSGDQVFLGGKIDI